MTTPPLLIRVSGPPPSWRRWLLSALYNFDRHTIYDWAGLMAGHLRRPDGVTAMQTARYTVDILLLVDDLRLATANLSARGHLAARPQLVDADRSLKNALDRLSEARNQLLKAAGAEHVTYD